jgi:short-subunit dehydrogenase
MNFAGLHDFIPEIIILFIATIVVIWIVSIVKVIVSWYLSTTWVRNGTAPKVSLIVGGSKGLGLALAHELLERGSSIILVGRGKEAIDAAVNELQSCAQSQKVVGFVGDAADDDWMLQTLTKLYDDNLMPDWIIANAGTSRPGFAADSFDDFRKQISSNYFTSTSIINALMKLAKLKSKKEDSKIMGLLTKKDLKAVLPKRLVFVGSFLSLTSFIGYSAYSGSKYALKGLSDALRSEFSFLDVKVHFYCPANMDTPGFALENEIKPKITAQIEGQASTSSPKDAALALIGGIFRERYVITNDLIGELVRVCANVSGPRPNPLSEAFASPVISLALEVFSFMVDRDVKNHFA